MNGTRPAPFAASNRGVSLELMLMTPERAQALLDTMHPNRTAKKRFVEVLVRDMLSGNWRITGDTIKVDSMGRLVDGQHRLMAVVQSGLAVEMAVAYGVTLDDALMAVDAGVKRSASDMLSMHGFSHANNLASVTRNVIAYRMGRPFDSSIMVSNSEILERAEQDTEGLTEAVRIGGRVHTSLSASLSVTGTIAYLAGNLDREDRDDFFEALITGVGLSENDPIRALRSRLEKDAAKRGQANPRMSRKYLAALTIKSWNMYRTGSEVSNLRWRNAGPKAETFPELL